MKFEYSKCFCDFSLIFLIFIFLTYPTEMEQFSHSILGKLCAVILIAYYTIQNLIYGLLFCIVVIYYYQIHHFAVDSKKVAEGFTSVDLYEAGKYTNYTEPVVYPERGEAELEFIQNHCDKGGDLKYKEFTINPEMTEHVFPEIQTTGHSVCNPCNPMCKFSVINNKLRTEDEIVKPKSSNEWVSIVIENLYQ